MRIIVTAALALSLVGCSGGGSSSSPTVNEYPWNSFSVSALSDLPSCSGDIIGRLYYVETINAFKVCKSTGWVTVNLQGSNGSDGLTINNVRYCSKYEGGITLKHNVVTYSTGDKFVYCSIGDNLNQYSSSIVYRSVQTGAMTEGCLLTYDIDTASAGFWNFSVNSGVRTAVYNDSVSSSNGTTVTFASSDCITSP